MSLEIPGDHRLSTLPPAPGYVLVVDDDDTTRLLISRWLTKAGLECKEARNGEEAIAAVATDPSKIDAIVLDVMMPGIDGFEVVRRLKLDPQTLIIPILLLTAHANNESEVVRSTELGVMDHLSKPFSGPVLVAKIRMACERARAERFLRTRLEFAEARATIDALTGLYNRREFDNSIRKECALATRQKRPFSLVMFDLDHFKSVNDTYGHEEGDRVLIHVARTVKSGLREDDLAFRYGGEEFALVLRGGGADQGAVAAERLRTALKSQPIMLGTDERIITFSAGVSSAEESNAFSTDDLVTRADNALYRAKRAGRDRLEREEPPSSAGP